MPYFTPNHIYICVCVIYTNNINIPPYLINIHGSALKTIIELRIRNRISYYLYNYTRT